MSLISEESSFGNIHRGDAYEDILATCDDTSVQLPFEPLAGEQTRFLGCVYQPSLGTSLVLALSDYRMFIAYPTTFHCCPIGLVDTLEIAMPSSLVINCSDTTQCTIEFPTQVECQKWRDRFLVVLANRGLKSAFSLRHFAAIMDSRQELKQSGSELELSSQLVREEFDKLQMNLGSCWKITDINQHFELCETYPKLLVVPKAMTDEELKVVSKFRSKGRIPAIVWRHENGCVLVRSSQPEVGWFSWRNEADEKLLLEISKACSNGLELANQHSGFHEPSLLLSNLSESSIGDDQYVRKMKIFDLRSYMAAFGNRTKGGGSENPEYYKNCILEYKGLVNIHDIYKSFKGFRSLLRNGSGQSFLSNLEGTKWLQYLSQIMEVSAEVVSTLEEARPVLVHCSDGWDRTAQVVSLAKLIADPSYRTLEGFLDLIKREWLEFGHKFEDRCSFQSEEKSPIFLQWCDSVYQLLQQFPCDFGFNESLLVYLVQHCYARLFGTFLGNCVKERIAAELYTKSRSIWDSIHQQEELYTNLLYTVPEGRTTLPVKTAVRDLILWKRLYCSTQQVQISAQDWDTSHEHFSLLGCSQQQSSAPVENGHHIPKKMDMSRMELPHHSKKEESLDINSKLENLSLRRKPSPNESYIQAIGQFLGAEGLVIEVDPIQQRLCKILKDDQRFTPKVHIEKNSRQSKVLKPCTPPDEEPELNSWLKVTSDDAVGVRWVPDHQVSACMKCQTSLTVWPITRKHHCRNCGGVFCGWCSNKSALVKNELLSSPVRVCDGCFDKLDGHLQRENGVKLQNLSSERNTICNAT